MSCLNLAAIILAVFLVSDNYYTKGEEAAGQWFGKGAERLDLFTNSLIDEKMLNVARGSVNNDKFDAMLKGNFNGIELGRIENGKRVHHPGWDHTFSAPKSVSNIIWHKVKIRFCKVNFNIIRVVAKIVAKVITKVVGKGAERLDLFTNSLIDDKFDAMLKGNFNGIELGRIENGKRVPACVCNCGSLSRDMSCLNLAAIILAVFLVSIASP
jgi:hypothetical protein